MAIRDTSATDRPLTKSVHGRLWRRWVPAGALAVAMERLPHEQREVLVMKIWNELTFAEIGEALEISQNTAASRYRYGLENLKKALRPNDQAGAAASASFL